MYIDPLFSKPGEAIRLTVSQRIALKMNDHMPNDQATTPNGSCIPAKIARRCKFGLYGLSAIWGATQIAFPEKELLHFLLALLYAFLATSWAVWDAKSRGIRIVPILQMLYFFLSPIGALIYLIYRSGMRGLLTAFLHGIGLIATIVLSECVTFYGLHFAGMLDPRYYHH